MQSTTRERPEFLPPPTPGLARGMVLALLAHGLLLLALTWGVRWNREDEKISVEAELWSPTPQQAAPRPVEPPPAPVPPAPPPPAPAPTPAPTPAPPPPPVQRDAEIAVEREKQRQAVEKKRAAEELERQKLAERRKQEELQKQAAAKKQEELQKQALAKKQEERERDEKAAKAKQQERQQQEARLRDQLRQEQMRRVQGLAGATGSPNDSGSALRSTGPSASYAARIAAAIKRNIVFNDVSSGNPAAVVTIRVAPDGTIVGKTLTKSSGNTAWDDAVQRAIDRTGSIPRDTDGRVVPEFPVTFRPND